MDKLDCEICKKEMKCYKKKKKIDGFVWRCRNCDKTKSIRYKSFFNKSKLHLSQIFLFIFCYFKFEKILSKYIGEIVNISEQTCVDWGNFLREEISAYFLENPLILGKNNPVQIDESMFGGKRKYNKGF